MAIIDARTLMDMLRSLAIVVLVGLSGLVAGVASL